MFFPIVRRSTKTDHDEEGPDETKRESGGESEDDEDDKADEEHTLLMNFRHKFESTLREPGRMLIVKDLVIAFDPSSIYGQRAGFLKGLLVTVPLIDGGRSMHAAHITSWLQGALKGSKFEFVV